MSYFVFEDVATKSRGGLMINWFVQLFDVVADGSSYKIQQSQKKDIMSLIDFKKSPDMTHFGVVRGERSWVLTQDSSNLDFICWSFILPRR